MVCGVFSDIVTLFPGVVGLYGFVVASPIELVSTIRELCAVWEQVFTPTLLLVCLVSGPSVGILACRSFVVCLQYRWHPKLQCLSVTLFLSESCGGPVL